MFFVFWRFFFFLFSVFAFLIFNFSSLKGSGPPVNKFDKLCKSLTLCTRCVAKDNVETGCDPSNVTYVTPVNIIADEKAIQVKCAELNPDNACGQNTCCCEMNLLAELLNLQFVRKFMSRVTVSRWRHQVFLSDVHKFFNALYSGLKRNTKTRFCTRMDGRGKKTV